MTLRFHRRDGRSLFPESLPVLSAGAHADPTEGACLMEYVSLLAGERFSDHPRTAHCAVAAMARAVNDVVADEVRPRLLPLAPDLIGTGSLGYDVDPLLVRIVAETACDLQPASRRARIALAGAQRRLRRLEGSNPLARVVTRLGARRYRVAAGGVLARLVAEDISPAGEPRAVAVLDAVVGECRRRAGRAPAAGAAARLVG